MHKLFLWYLQDCFTMRKLFLLYLVECVPVIWEASRAVVKSQLQHRTALGCNLTRVGPQIRSAALKTTGPRAIPTI